MFVTHEVSSWPMIVFARTTTGSYVTVCLSSSPYRASRPAPLTFRGYTSLLRYADAIRPRGLSDCDYPAGVAAEPSVGSEGGEQAGRDRRGGVVNEGKLADPAAAAWAGFFPVVTMDSEL